MEHQNNTHQPKSGKHLEVNKHFIQARVTITNSLLTPQPEISEKD
jgi:hypothetical protein